MLETIKTAASIVGYLGTVGGVFLFLWKQWKKIKDIADAQKCQLRSDILAIYYRHCDEEEPTMREYERKNLDALYAAYEVLHGNTFVKDIYEDQMRHWKVTR
jgi:hypothetical protein